MVTPSQMVNSLNIEVPEACKISAPHLDPHCILELVAHFETVASETLGTSFAQPATKSIALSQALESPYLLATILAFSASHLLHLHPKVFRYQLATTCFGARGIHLYSEELKAGLNATNIDGVLLTCIILSVLSFYTENEGLESTMALSSNTESQSWLSVISGLSILRYQKAVREHLSSSIYLHAIQDTATDQCNTATETLPGAQGLPLFLSNLCNIDSNSTVETNPYLAATRLVMDMLCMSNDGTNFCHFMAFLWKIQPDYAQLLREKDERALLLLSYWLAKICDIDQWWCKTRARVECQGICRFLEGSTDQDFQALLQYPMQKCDYRTAGRVA